MSLLVTTVAHHSYSNKNNKAFNRFFTYTHRLGASCTVSANLKTTHINTSIFVQ